MSTPVGWLFDTSSRQKLAWTARYCLYGSRMNMMNMTPNIAKQIECWTKIELKNWHHLLNCTVGTETVVEIIENGTIPLPVFFFWPGSCGPHKSFPLRGNLFAAVKQNKTIHPLPVKGDHWRPRLRSEILAIHIAQNTMNFHPKIIINHLKSSLITINYPFYCPHVAPAASHPEALRSWPILLLRWAESCLLPRRRRAAFSIALVGIRWIVNCATPLLPSVGRMRSWAIISSININKLYLTFCEALKGLRDASSKLD